MKILLLGGNGYIGSRCWLYLNTIAPTASVDLQLFGKNLGYSTQGDYRTTDITPYDVIILLAGHSSVQMANCDSRRSWSNNVEGFLDLCNRLGENQKLIYASSASVYTKTLGVALEDTPINFSTVNNYDLQKITVDLVASRYINSGKNIIGLRFGTVNGPAPNTRSDLMLNSMVKSALDTGVIYLKNPGIRRTILGVADLAGALGAAIRTKLPPGQYNLGSFTSTAGEMAEIVARKTGATVVTLPGDQLTYDYEMSSEKFTNATGYTPIETAESIVDALVKAHPAACYSIRDTDRSYSEQTNT